MKKLIKLLLTASSVAVLAACGGGGGGGGGGGSTEVATVNNPLKKYEGTYYVCDGREKETITATAVGENTLQISTLEEIYSNTNCTGTVVGTYRLPQPYTATYQSQTVATLPAVTVLPSSGTVDVVIFSLPAMTAQLTGSGVQGNCVKYTNGEVCYDSLVLTAETETGALYQNGNYIVTFIRENGILEAYDMYSKISNFNYNQLVRD